MVEGEEGVVLEGRGEGSGHWKMTIAAEAFAKCICKVVWKEQRSWRVASTPRDSSLAEAAAGKQVWEQTGASLRSRGPGTIWKTSASFVRAIATYLELGSDGVSV